MKTPENFLIGQPLDQETKDKLFVVYQGTGISLDSFETLISNLIIKCTPIPDYKKLGRVTNSLIVNDNKNKPFEMQIKNNTINKIQSDKAKETCECTYFQGTNKKYKTDTCRSCMHKQGKSFVKKEQEKRQEEAKRIKFYNEAQKDALKQYLEATKIYHKSENKPENKIKNNWFQKLFK